MPARHVSYSKLFFPEQEASSLPFVFNSIFGEEEDAG
jgi:hypothetical protein